MNGIIAVSSEIGRGHAQYLDSVLSYLPDVLKIVPTGPGWHLARQIYLIGSKGGIFTSLYNRIRRKRPSRILLKLIDSGITKRFQDYHGLLLVDHPILAHLLAPICRVAYLHAEIAAPVSSLHPSIWRIFVPLPETARQFLATGARAETICITGLVIEPELLLVAEPAIFARLHRLQSDSPLTVAFFTSGAYPHPHLRAIILAARSLASTQNQTIIFAGTSTKVASGLKRVLPPETKIITAKYRQEERKITAELLPQLDVMVCAAHERTNWAVGLGLPMFCLLPNIGPFAPLNFQFAYRQGVCLPLQKPSEFATLLTTLHQNQTLYQMAHTGWGKHPLTGAEFIADILKRHHG
ncbi:MAG: hypothetical protein ACUVUR_04700 [bacterium]